MGETISHNYRLYQ